MSPPFPGVLGHEYAREGLWRSINEGRLHHATLIHGLQGVGKRTLSIAVARTLICLARSLGPCETCLNCQRTAKGIHPDLIVLAREDMLGIDPEVSEAWEEDRKSPARMLKVATMRKAGNWLLQMPFEASRRVLVIVDAQDMNVPAANVFLKSLEEPAAGNVAILTSSSPSFLRPTIRSRCAEVRLTGVPQNLIEAHLRSKGVSAEEARFQAQGSGGSLARALQTRAPLNELRDQLLLAFTGGRPSEIAAFLASSMAGGVDVDRDEALHLFATLLRDIAVLQAGGRRDTLVHSAVSDAVARAAEGPIEAFALFSKVVEARGRLAGQANRVILWDDLLHDAGSGG